MISESIVILVENVILYKNKLYYIRNLTIKLCFYSLFLGKNAEILYEIPAKLTNVRSDSLCV